MNKKSIRNKSTQPVQKALPAAVHAATMALDGEHPGDDTAGADALFVTADLPADLVDAAPSEAEADPAPAKPATRKADKPGKAVTFSLSLPASEAALFDALREQYQPGEGKLKKSILLRAALLALAESDDERIAAIVAGLQAPAEEKPAKTKAKPKSKK